MITTDTYKTFFALLRLSLQADGASQHLEPELQHITATGWPILHRLAADHALLGVVWIGVQRLPKDLMPTKEVSLKWLLESERIKNMNEVINQRAARLTQGLMRDGFRSCILKGQGNALMYPDAFSRTPGDIDVWVEGGHKRVMAYVRGHFPQAGARYHHTDFPAFKDVDVEVHFMPTWMSEPLDNRRLQRWFAQNAEAQFTHQVQLPHGVGTIQVPTDEVNCVFQLIHIYHHFFDEGVGLRQLMDYYYLLKQAFSPALGRDELKRRKQAVVNQVQRLHLTGFAQAIMYVLELVFHLSQDYRYLPSDSQSGKYVLAEVLAAGNFGKAGTSIKRSGGKDKAYFVSKLGYKWHFLKHYPRETFWGNAFWVWQRLWRMRHGYITKL